MQYAIRVTHNQLYEDHLPQTFPEEEFSEVLGVYHTGKSRTNPHMHIIIKTNILLQTLRKKLKAAWTLGQGNGHMSIKKFDGARKGYSYMFHEHERSGFRVVMNRGFTGGELEEFISHHQVTIKSIKDNSPNQILERIAEKLLREKPNKHQYDYDDLGPLIWNDLRERGQWMPNKFQMERWLMKLCTLLTPEHSKTWEGLQRSWLDQMFPWDKYPQFRKN